MGSLPRERRDVRTIPVEKYAEKLDGACAWAKFVDDLKHGRIEPKLKSPPYTVEWFSERWDRMDNPYFTELAPIEQPSNGVVRVFEGVRYRSRWAVARKPFYCGFRSLRSASGGSRLWVQVAFPVMQSTASVLSRRLMIVRDLFLGIHTEVALILPRYDGAVPLFERKVHIRAPVEGGDAMEAFYDAELGRHRARKRR